MIIIMNTIMMIKKVGIEIIMITIIIRIIIEMMTSL